MRKTAENCSVERNETNGRPVLRGETVSSLEASSLDDGASGTGPHTGAESMLALAAPHVWLIGTLHSEVSLLGRSRYDREDCGRLNPTSFAVLTISPAREREVARLNAKSRRRTRNVVGCHSRIFLSLPCLFPIFPIPDIPCGVTVIAIRPLSRSVDTAPFPVLAVPLSPDIYSPTLPCKRPYFLEGISGPRRHTRSGPGRENEFFHSLWTGVWTGHIEVERSIKSG